MPADPAAAVNRAAWDRQAGLVLAADQPMTTRSRVEWTQYPGHGPGTELCGDVRGLTVAELGCGNGDNLAPLAVAGAHCIGVDISPAQIARAHIRWGHLDLQLHCGDARDFLSSESPPLDLCLSIFGAVGLCPPGELLPLVAARLRPGGRILFSVPDPQWLGGRRDQMRLADGTHVPVARWTHTAAGWAAAIRSAGLRVAAIHQVDSPNGDGPCCTIMAATPGQPVPQYR